MTFTRKILSSVNRSGSIVSVGLDTDITKIPQFLLKEKDPVFEFNKMIIDETYRIAAAYKLNLGFYESFGARGFESALKTVEYIPAEVLKIGDGKRGDIGNSSKMYAKAIFEYFNFDAVTVSPYMGKDSIEPFAEYKDKGVFVLCITSNPGAGDFQKIIDKDGVPLYLRVLEKVNEWNINRNLGVVAGATKPEELIEIKKQANGMPILIPGVGSQGGDLQAVLRKEADEEILLINSSRGIIYASDGKDFHAAAKEKLTALNLEIEQSRS
ncbi:orotidine-5'-phosphate decarboxylase [candidate division KSB1 bacterium]